jgi:2-C-methyl-D-erythritol 4-phosphate cytidylyltransferase/2-C-methyl-D-erythritol 2,4-cyclodiphosphate synthase
MSTAALIVAAGRGSRFGGALPKQYIDVCGQSVLARSVAAFATHDRIDLVQVVIHPDDRGLYDGAIGDARDSRLLPPVSGSRSRSGSVRVGLEALCARNLELVLIHDAARPFVSAQIISAVLDALNTAPAAFPALAVVDALWRAEGAMVHEPVTRDGLWRAQTPQGFRFADILAAHRSSTTDAADDVALARNAGMSVRLVEGSEDNFKITTVQDLDRARAVIGENMDIRTGNGFDVHRFGPGNSVTLCGVEIAHPNGLVGHSDADVGMHAITDAIFGALAEGDIGQWFPPSDAKWKNARSETFLCRAMSQATEKGFSVTHVDCTLVCETPKIGPHSGEMRAELSRITGLEPQRISVKATTSETLGFTGRREGIAAFATATLVRQ